VAIYATVSDVELEWGHPVTDATAGNVAWLIDKAEMLILASVPGLPARITAGRASVGQVAHVAAAMVVRVLRNPEGKQAETAGDYSYQLASSSGVTAGHMFLSTPERNLLRGRAGAGSLQLVDDAREFPLRRPPFVQGCGEWTVLATGEAP